MSGVYMKCFEDYEQNRLKELCKVSRKQLGYSNQDIADLITAKFDIPEFSVNTVNNFFSERSKAASIYTTGYICSVLDISIDETFGIVREVKNEDILRLQQRTNQLEQELSLSHTEADKLRSIIAEKDERITAAHRIIEQYRQAAHEDRNRVPAWAFRLLMITVIILVFFIVGYLIYFDLRNSDYGLFK